MDRRSFIKRLTASGVVMFTTPEDIIQPKRTIFIPPNPNLYQRCQLIPYGHIVTVTENTFRSEIFNGMDYGPTRLEVMRSSSGEWDYAMDYWKENRGPARTVRLSVDEKRAIETEMLKRRYNYLDSGIRI